MRRLIGNFRIKLATSRFPMIEERIKHLSELIDNEDHVNRIVFMVLNNDDIDIILKFMVGALPGYASDMFLKRAQLFLMQVNRGTGLLDVSRCTIPADYQVPKILRHKGCLEYSDELWDKLKKYLT